VDALNWRKASYSASNGGCVEVAGHAGRVLVRDTRDRVGPVVTFTPEAWRRFAGQVKGALASGPGCGWTGASSRAGVPLRRVGAAGLFRRWPGSAGTGVSAGRCAGFRLARGSAR
jgi:Domain of unknown function (DUF397)